MFVEGEAVVLALRVHRPPLQLCGGPGRPLPRVLNDGAHQTPQLQNDANN